MTLPFIIKKDNSDLDVLVIQDKLIPLNKKNTTIDYQMAIYKHCNGNMEYQAYQIKDQLYVIKETLNYQDYNESTYKLISKEDIVNLNTTIEDQYCRSFVTFNSKYIVIADSDYECPIINVLAAYDIENKKRIDCSDSRVSQELTESVIKYRRCLYDVIASILTDKILMIDESRLFNFMSFIVNDKVDKDNYNLYTHIVKDYIIHYYPNFKDSEIPTDKKTLLSLNSRYGINYFAFKKIPYDIVGLTYLYTNTKKKRLCGKL